MEQIAMLSSSKINLNCFRPLKLSQQRAQFNSKYAIKRRSSHIVASGKGFGKKDYKYQDELKNQRSIALGATDVLAKLLQAEDKVQEVAKDYVESLNEEFFHIGSAYLQMAKKEGDEAVAAQLEKVLKIAMEAKNSTLRPEIQLLNKLLGTDTDLQRRQLLNSQQAGEILQMNNFYFFNLVERMTNDVNRQPNGPQKDALADKLRSIREEAVGRLPEGAKNELQKLK